jgi:Fe-S-cluster-containing dehydrogenase component
MKSLPLVQHSSKNEAVDAQPELDGDGLSRRRWMQLMGASTALGAAAAGSGCRYEQETIKPFAFRPEGYVPGATVKKSALCEFGGVARSLLATIYDGRPIKVDGNDMLKSQGLASTSLVQALTLQLYDPDRSRGVMTRVKTGSKSSRLEKSTREQFDAKFAEFLASDALAAGGAGLAVLVEPSSSPTMARLKTAFQQKFPAAGWFEYAAVTDDQIVGGTQLCFGAPYRPWYRFDNAEVVVALDSDPFGSDLNSPEYARDFAKSRDVDVRHKMSRLWSVGSVMNVSAGMADERLPLASSKIESFLVSLEEALAGTYAPSGKETEADRFLKAMASDLKANSGHAIIVLGSGHSASLHARVWKLNQALGAIGATAELRECLAPHGGGAHASLQALAAAIDAGSVKGLLVLGGNPVYAAPTELKIGEKISAVEFSVHLGLYEDETAAVCGWHVNQAQALETWSDGRVADGTWCIGQPSIAPLFGGSSVIEMLGSLIGESGNGETLIKATSKLEGDAWAKALHDGFADGTAIAPATSVTVSPAFAPAAVEASWRQTATPALASAEIVFIAGGVFDGQFANLGWLQEAPDGISKVCWGNPAIVSPATAVAWGVRQNQVVKLTAGEKSVRVPVHLVPGTAPGVIALAYGYGRTEAGRIGGSRKAANRAPSVGVNVNEIRGAANWSLATAVVAPTQNFEEVATTQEHHYVDSLSLSVVNERVPRLAREGELADYLKFVAAHAHHDAHDHGDHDHGPDEKHEAGSGEEHGQRGAAVVATPVVARSTVKGGDEKAGGHGHHDHWPVLPGHHPENFELTPGPGYRDMPKWAMTIDLNKCTGCSACVIACQAENNISVVGKDQVIRGRELSWIRVDRYFLPRETGQLSNPTPGQELYENPKVVLQPLTCHHCENAPCEQVCPVAATVHSDEGLNDMVYNRCIGTRYCGNNCPFKVRRFNYHNYSNAIQFIGYPDALASLDGGIRRPAGDVKMLGLAMNPEVTVRSRGVMEKCTFCVQRIQNGKIAARNEGRDYRRGEFQDGEVTTACQDVCPTQAIVFGDVSVKGSRVAQGFESQRGYAMLNELNLGSRLKYLARVRNPHPDLAPQKPPTDSVAAKG